MCAVGRVLPDADLTDYAHEIIIKTCLNIKLGLCRSLYFIVKNEAAGGEKKLLLKYLKIIFRSMGFKLTQEAVRTNKLSYRAFVSLFLWSTPNGAFRMSIKVKNTRIVSGLK